MVNPMNGPSPVPDYPAHPQPPAETARLDDDRLADLAGEILDTGDRPIIADDYDGRSVRFAEEMAQLSPEDGARLVQELLRQDGGALGSWLKLDILDRMRSEGRIDQAQFAAVSEGFAQAYNDGRLGDADAARFLQIDALDDRAPALVAEQFSQMRGFLDAAGDSPAMQQFREDFAGQLLSGALGDNAGWAPHAPGLAMQIAADSGDPGMAARVFNDVLEANGGSAATRSTLLDAIGQSSIGFENSQGAVDGLVNPMAALVDSVAAQPGTAQWNDIAVAIARYAESSDDGVFFDPYTDRPIGATADALTALLAGEHGDAILTALNHWDPSAAPGGDGHAQQAGRNAIEMGNLLRITAFNPDNPRAGEAMDAIQAWTQLRKDYLNGVQRDDYPADMSVSQAREQLGMLGGAAFDAVQQMKIDQDNRAAATEALVGFVVDLGLSVVPGGGTISGLVASDLKAAFGNNPRIDGLIDQALSGGDTLTSGAVDRLKQDIADAMSDEQMDLEAFRTTASNFVANAVFSGLSEGTQGDGGQSHRDIVKGHVQNVQDDIQDNRA